MVPTSRLRHGSGLGKCAVGVLSIVVLCQLLFLASVMRAMHRIESETDTDSTGASDSHASVADDRPIAGKVQPLEVPAFVASWRQCKNFFESRPLPFLRTDALYTTLREATNSTNNNNHSTALPMSSRDQPSSRPSEVKSDQPSSRPSEVKSDPPSSRPSDAPAELSSRKSEAPQAGLTTRVRPHTKAPQSEKSRMGNQHRLQVGTAGALVETEFDVHMRTGLTTQDYSSIEHIVPVEDLTNLKDAALLILCFNRPQNLEKTIAGVKVARLSQRIRKYISQDGDDGETQMVAKSSGDGFDYLSHPRTLRPTLEVLDEEGRPKETPSTMFLAAHYKWALDQLFLKKGHSHVIVLEDDMRVSDDFFEMFEVLAPLLDIDPSLWCISSWNDNGFRSFELPKDKFFRSSYFPGLGWMLKRSMWEELSPIFPQDNWDHWMRATTTSRHRECISPWVSRNYNIGVGGATSNEEFYAQFLEPIVLYRGPALNYGENLTYLLNRNYFTDMEERIRSVPSQNILPAPMVTTLSSGLFGKGKSYLVYYAHEEFDMLGQSLGIHPTPRSSYRRSQWLKFEGADIFLVDRRLSPFIPPHLRLRPHRTLKAATATQPGMNCIEACRQLPAEEAGLFDWTCAADQFDFVNDCQVLNKTFGCPNGCTQGWGEDIPNREVEGVGHAPLCLATEVVPTCDASFRLTKRLCPCIARKQLQSNDAHPPDDIVDIVAAPHVETSCDRTCQLYKGNGKTLQSSSRGWRCEPSRFADVNSCEALQQNFPCASCTPNVGSELPSFVSSKSSGNFGKCFVNSQHTPSCSGTHPDTLRLCPCVPTQ